VEYDSTPPGVAKATGTAAGASKLGNQLEPGPQYRNQHQLRDSLSDINSETLAAAIPTGHEKLPLVIGIDEPYEVSQNDTVLVAEARARQDKRSHTRLPDMDRHPGG
jgi:hypothetical protein